MRSFNFIFQSSTAESSCERPTAESSCVSPTAESGCVSPTAKTSCASTTVKSSYASPTAESSCVSPTVQSSYVSPTAESSCANTTVKTSYVSPTVHSGFVLVHPTAKTIALCPTFQDAKLVTFKSRGRPPYRHCRCSEHQRHGALFLELIVYTSNGTKNLLLYSARPVASLQVRSTLLLQICKRNPPD
jgi:hypothetical protein